MTVRDTGRPLSAYLDQDYLVIELRQTLQQTLFSSGGRISPHRVNQLGQEVAEAFFKFLETEDKETARTYGRHLAMEGMGHRSILTMTEALRRVCRESANPAAALPSVAGRYVNALLEGYMAGREASLLQEQERTLRAFQRARERHDQ